MFHLRAICIGPSVLPANTRDASNGTHGFTMGTATVNAESYIQHSIWFFFFLSFPLGLVHLSPVAFPKHAM